MDQLRGGEGVRLAPAAGHVLRGVLGGQQAPGEHGAAFDQCGHAVAQRLYFVYRLRPYAARLPRALRREPKVYLWDWSEIADPAVRLENMVASHLLKWCHFTQDWGHPPLDLHFVRDKEKREVDFLVTREKKPWLLVEVSASLLRRQAGREAQTPGRV